MEQDTRHTAGGAPAGDGLRHAGAAAQAAGVHEHHVRRVEFPRRGEFLRRLPQVLRAGHAVQRGVAAGALDGPGVVVRPGHPRPRRGGEDGVQPDAAVQVHDATRGAPAGAGSPPPSPAPGAGCSGRRRGGARAPSRPPGGWRATRPPPPPPATPRPRRARPAPPPPARGRGAPAGRPHRAATRPPRARGGCRAPAAARSRRPPPSSRRPGSRRARAARWAGPPPAAPRACPPAGACPPRGSTPSTLASPPSRARRKLAWPRKPPSTGQRRIPAKRSSSPCAASISRTRASLPARCRPYSEKRPPIVIPVRRPRRPRRAPRGPW